MTLLRQQEDIAARALEFTILTAARTSETIGARRLEFNVRGESVIAMATLPVIRLLPRQFVGGRPIAAK